MKRDLRLPRGRRLLGAALLVACGACAHGAALEPLQARPKGAEGPAALGADDVFEVHVFNEPDLSGTYRVATDGSVNFPLAGRLELAGLSPADAADLLA